MQKQERVPKIQISKAIESAEKVWVINQKNLPFKTKDEYLKWVRDSCEYVNALSGEKRRDYFAKKEMEVRAALKVIEKQLGDNVNKSGFKK